MNRFSCMHLSVIATLHYPSDRAGEMKFHRTTKYPALVLNPRTLPLESDALSTWLPGGIIDRESFNIHLL